MIWDRNFEADGSPDLLKTSARKDRRVVIWTTGLSGSGKSTLALAVSECLWRLGRRNYVLDGDRLREGLCADLGYSMRDRKENIRRAGEVAKLLVDAGAIVIAALISPLTEDRQSVRKMFGDTDFLEVYCACPIEICESRDVKGLYKKARAGQLTMFTGISSPYEPPCAPELAVHSQLESLEESVRKVVSLLFERGILATSEHEQALDFSS